MELNDHVFALKNIIDAQQQVITLWESIFNSAESTILNLVKINLELKVQLIHQINPDFKLPENIYRELDAVREAYHQGKISPLEYFESLDIMLSQIAI